MKGKIKKKQKFVFYLYGLVEYFLKSAVQSLYETVPLR